MKNIKFLLLALFVSLAYQSCQQDDDLEFTAAPMGEFTFTNSFLSEYLLTEETSGNIAERFVFNPADFDVPTNVSYQLQYSINGDFSDAMDIGPVTSGNEISLTVGDLITIAMEAGLDNDPSTDDMPDTADIAFRVRAFPGNGSSTTEIYSPTQILTIRWLEQTTGGGSDVEPVSWGVVGSGYNNWGAFEDGTFYSTDEDNVFVTYVTLIDGEIKFRENNDWPSNLGDDGADGTVEPNGANIAVTAGTYRITLNLNDNTYLMEPYSLGIVGSAYNDWGNAGPDAKMYYDYTTDTFKVGVKLLDGAMKIRLNNEWNVNYGDTGADGTLEANGDDITVSAGHYLITADFNTNMYTIESADVLGVVGSAYNDWGGAGPDFALTEIQPDIYYGDIITLLDGAMKFRVNNEWDINYGDTGADGTLEANGDDITVSAGMYRVYVDLNMGLYELRPLQ